MNCKPGDLAVIVKTHPREPATKQFLGRLVRLTTMSAAEVDSWNHEGMPLIGRYRGKSVEWYSLPDEWLRPIRDPGDDARDESFVWAPAPEKVTA